jgi:predicted transcriptional regulator
MELHFTPEQEAQLAQIASQEGTDAERLVKQAALRLLQEDARFRAAVREGIAQADRGEFIEQAEMRPPGADVALIKMRIRWTPAAAADLQRTPSVRP